MWALWAAWRGEIAAAVGLVRPRPGLIAVILALTFGNAWPAPLQSFDSYHLRALVSRASHWSSGIFSLPFRMNGH